MFQNDQLCKEFGLLAKIAKTKDLDVEAHCDAKGVHLSVFGYEYEYETHNDALEDAALLVVELGLVIEEHYVLRAHDRDVLFYFKIVHAPNYYYDPEEFPEVLGSNHYVEPLHEYGPFGPPIHKRPIGRNEYCVYRSHPELNFEERPFIIKDMEGHDIGEGRFKNPQEAQAFLDGIEWVIPEHGL